MSRNFFADNPNSWANYKEAIRAFEGVVFLKTIYIASHFLCYIVHSMFYLYEFHTLVYNLAYCNFDEMLRPSAIVPIILSYPFFFLLYTALKIF
jgi:hypothetical protein